MNFLKELFNPDKMEVIKENTKMRASKKNLEKQLKQEILNNAELKDKYIALLEEKGEAFDKYVHYEQEAIRLADEKRELKKELALAKEELKKEGR